MANLRVKAKFHDSVTTMTVMLSVRGPKTGTGKKPYGRIRQIGTDTSKDAEDFFQVNFTDIPTPTQPKKLVIRVAGMNSAKKIVALHTKRL